MFKKEFAVFIFFIALVVPIVLGQEQNSCINCHSEQILDSAHDTWSISTHGLRDITCENCHLGDPTKTEKERAHAGVKPATDTESSVYFENVPKTCSNCHPDEYNEFIESKHYLNLRRELLAPVCSTCHGSHYITSVDPLYISEKCVICHNDEREIFPEVPKQAREALVLLREIKDEISKAKSNIEIARKKGQDVTDAVTSLREAERGLERSGANWHNFEIIGFKEELSDVLYHATASSNLAHSLASSTCVSCHSTLSKTTKEYEKYEQWSKSSHADNGITCDLCHGGDPESVNNSHTGMKVPSTENIPIVCETCHRNPEYFKSAHWETLQETLETKSGMFTRGVFVDKIAEGEQDATGPECTTCHGGHNIQSSRNPESTIYYLDVPETCGTVCHKKEYFDFKESLHYKNLKDKQLAPECVTCHGNHEVKILTQEETTEFCTICHLSGTPEVKEGTWHAFNKPAESLVVCGPTTIMLLAIIPSTLYGIGKKRKGGNGKRS